MFHQCSTVNEYKTTHALSAAWKEVITCVWAVFLTSNLMRCRLLSWLGNEGHPDRALEVFDWLEGRREYVTEVCILYTRLASMYARQKGGLETAMHIFDRMQARGIRADTVAFNSAITVASELPTAIPCMKS